ncbi:phosphotransferase family protein [Caulobacter sp. X]|uniref:phosphotransferase family protein n=1 Tax=Caulobacter sp. X TaxID=2048901 RepID=UPI001F2F42A7|nr:aminoglycoside phosphotransferase family protein [Caulobacter sp. X]
MVEPELFDRCHRLMGELGLTRPGASISVRPLTGGVSSDVLRVDTDHGRYCVKFALEQLRVSADWKAPVHRNAAEYRWLEFVAAFAPDNVPKLFGRSAALGGFAMELLDAPDLRNWKTDLLANRPREADVRGLARLIGMIHARSSAEEGLATKFANQEDFEALRIEPYLRSLIVVYPKLTEPIGRMAQDLALARTVLVHGDVSPKNILFVGARPVLLDAECATMGDPVFDVAFCLNHFLLKAIRAPARARALLDAVRHFLDEYGQALTWEDQSAFEVRLARLLPMLLLARIDGKSPVEYLDEVQRQAVRSLAVPLIAGPPETVGAILTAFEGDLH